MDISLLKDLKELFIAAPAAFAAIVIAKMGFDYLRNQPHGDYINKKDCHAATDRMREEFNNNISTVLDAVRSLETDVKKMYEMLFNHVNRTSR